MQFKRGILTSTLANIAGSLVPIVIQLVTIPIYLRIIGTERYGTLSLVWLLLGYFGLFDLGLGRAVASAVAQSHADLKKQAQIFWAGSILSLVAGILGAAALYFVGSQLFKHVLNVSAEMLRETNQSLPLIALTLPIATFMSALSGGLQGRQAFILLNAVQLSGMILYQLLPLFAAILVSNSLETLILAAIVGRMFSLVALCAICFPRFPFSEAKNIERADAARLLSYGGWATVTGAIAPLLTVVDRFVIGVYIGMSAVGLYSIPYGLMTRLAVLPTSLQVSLFPRYAMASEGDSRSIVTKSIHLQSMIMTPIIVAAIGFIRIFLEIWIGEEHTTVVAPIAEIFLFGLWFNTLAYIPFSFLQGRGRPDIPAKLHFVELLIYVPTLFALTIWFGLIGAAFAWTLRAVLDAVLLFVVVRPEIDRGRLLLSGGWVALALFWVLAGTATTVASYVCYAFFSLACFGWASFSIPAEIRNDVLGRFARKSA